MNDVTKTPLDETVLKALRIQTVYHDKELVERYRILLILKKNALSLKSHAIQRVGH